MKSSEMFGGFIFLSYLCSVNKEQQQTITTMRKMKNLYNNYDINDEAWVEAFKEHCKINEIELPSDAENSGEFYDWQSDQLSMEWEDFLTNLENDKENNVNCVVTGNIGRWNGNFDIEAKAFASLKAAVLACVSNMDYVVINEIDGTIDIEAIHHDGTNIFKIHKLNKNGLDAYCNDEEFDKEEYYEKFDIKW